MREVASMTRLLAAPAEGSLKFRARHGFELMSRRLEERWSRQVLRGSFAR